MKITRESYRLLTVLQSKAELGPRVFRTYAKRIMRPRALNMLDVIHTEIAPKIQALHVLDTVGEEKEIEVESVPSVRKGWTWGKVGKTIKGNLPREHGMGMIESDLSVENSIGFRLTTV